MRMKTNLTLIEVSDDDVLYVEIYKYMTEHLLKASTERRTTETWRAATLTLRLFLTHEEFEPFMRTFGYSPWGDRKWEAF